MRCIVCGRSLEGLVRTRPLEPRKPWMWIALNEYPLCSDYSYEHQSREQEARPTRWVIRTKEHP